MSATEYLIDTNILIYHTTGSQESMHFIGNVIASNSFYISVLTKIEFLGWHKHTTDGYEKCMLLIKPAHVLTLEQEIADKAIELKRSKKIGLGDAVIAATATIKKLTLVTRNTDDFKDIAGLEIINPFA